MRRPPHCRLGILTIAGLALACLLTAGPAGGSEPKAEATPIERLKVAEGFRVERLYSVPRNKQGSWVSMCTAPDGRLIVCDQYGGLFYVKVPPIGSRTAIEVEPIRVDIGEAQGLLWAFDSLYVVVNRGQKYASGLYRVTDSDGDGKLDHVSLLRALRGGGEHGPHAVLKTGDGKGLIVVCGDNTKLPELAASRVPRNWDEDLLLPRAYGRGFMKGTPAQGGFVCRVTPDGKQWELISLGFRNQYDIARHGDGDWFTYDADMEWDINTPWYRPTRVCLSASGADFGWRNGGGKWPPYYPDTLPATIDIGPGSPTGVCFGYGTKFPAKYQRALYICDWSYGKLYAVHLEPDGAAYRAVAEEFVSGIPLPLTDLVVHPDGAIYFAIGGRRVQSGLYRITYTGSESVARAAYTTPDPGGLRALRRKLESLHGASHSDAVSKAWPYLGHKDRWIRHAARIAIEHRPRSEWEERVFSESDDVARIDGLLALARSYRRPDRPKGPELDNQPPDWNDPPRAASPERAAMRDRMLESLHQLDWHALSVEDRLNGLRTLSLVFIRVAPPTPEQRSQLAEILQAQFPQGNHPIDSELARLLVYLQAPQAAERLVKALEQAPTQEQQIDFAASLRFLDVGWTPELRRRYFEWFRRAATFRGGMSFALFVSNIRADAEKRLSKNDREAIAELLKAPPIRSTMPAVTKPRPLVKNWKLEDLLPAVESGLSGRNYERGKQMFSAALCFNCHRFDQQGGAIGPDLTGVGRRFSLRDILESVVEPSKVISDQYAAIAIHTTDGRVVVGRIVNLSGDGMNINTDMLDPSKVVAVKRGQIEEIAKSPTSMMPAGLINTLKRDEILDLLAYLVSGGDPKHPMFQETGGTSE